MVDLVKALRSRANWETATGITEPHEHIDWMAANEIERLREELAAGRENYGKHIREAVHIADALREENARLRELLDDAFAQWDGDWPEELVARVKAVIGAEQATGGP